MHVNENEVSGTIDYMMVIKCTSLIYGGTLQHCELRV